MKKTFKFKEVPLSKEERFQFDVLVAENQLKKSAFDKYLLGFVCPRAGLDTKNAIVQYDLPKGEFTYEEREQPLPQNKSGEGGNTQAPPGGNVQREGDSNG